MTTNAPGFVGPLGRSALVRLAWALERFFKSQRVEAAVYLGLKKRDLHDTSRVVLIDGEFDGSNTPKPRSAGSFVAPWQKQSVNPRELVGWERPITLSIRAVDARHPDSEDAQTEATEALIEATVQGLHNAMWQNPVTGAWLAIGQNNIDWAGSKAVWVDPGTATQQTWGKEFLVGFLYKCVFFDAAEGVAYPSPVLQKGPLLSSADGGVNASIASTAPAAGTAIVSGLGLCDPSMVGKGLALAGASSAGNNGTFPISFFLSSTSLVVANANASAPDANNGAIRWQLAPSP